MHDNITDEVIRLAPPVGVSTLTLMGCTMSDIVYMMTIIYILVNIVCRIYITIHVAKKEVKDKHV